MSGVGRKKNRHGGDVRWFEAAPCYIYHVVNAFEEGATIVRVGTAIFGQRDYGTTNERLTGTQP